MENLNIAEITENENVVKTKKWTILFVRAGAEDKVAQAISKIADVGEFFPFVPTKIVSYRSRGVFTKVKRNLFPGYIFVETEIEEEFIAERLRALFTQLPQRGDIFSILHYFGNKNNVAMREKERRYWERLLAPNTGYCVAESEGYIVGDLIRVTSGPLVGMESRIKKINRRKREAIVEVELMGDLRTLKLMLDIVEKVK